MIRHETEMKKLAQALFVCLLAGVMLVGCDQAAEMGSQIQQRVQATTDLFQYVPDSQYLTLGYTDVQNLVNNPWAQELFELYPALRVWDENLGVSINRFDNFAFSMSLDENRRPQGLVIMRSDLDEEEILALIGEKKRFFDKEKVGKRIQYISGEEFSFGIINDQIVALGSPSLVRKSLRAANGEIKNLGKSKNIERFKPYFEKNDDFWISIQNLGQYINYEGIEFVPRGLLTIDFVYFGLSTSNGISGQFIGEAEDADGAGKIARSLAMIKGITKQLSKGILQYTDEADTSGIPPKELKQMFEAFVDNIDITSEGKQVVIRFEFPDRLLDFFLEVSQQTLDESRRRSNTGGPDGIGDF